MGRDDNDLRVVLPLPCRHKQFFELANGTHVPNLGESSFYRFNKRRKIAANVLTAKDAISKLEPPPLEPSGLMPCAGEEGRREACGASARPPGSGLARACLHVLRPGGGL